MHRYLRHKSQRQIGYCHLPSRQFWTVVSISAFCVEIMILEHGLLEIIFDFGHTRRSFVSVKQLTLTLLFIFRDGIWFVLTIGATILLWAHPWETNVPLDSQSSRGCCTKRDRNPNYQLYIIEVKIYIKDFKQRKKNTITQVASNKFWIRNRKHAIGKLKAQVFFSCYMKENNIIKKRVITK